jgi:hypothetical protein
MRLAIKGFKDWATDDGGGYQFTLLADGKRFAFVHNDGNGGEVDLKFFDTDAPKVEIVSLYDDDQTPYRGTPNEKRLTDYVRALPPWQGDGEPMDYSVGMLMDELVNDYEREKRLKKYRKKGVVFKLTTDGEGSMRVINTLDMAVAKQYLDSKFPNQYQIL